MTEPAKPAPPLARGRPKGRAGVFNPAHVRFIAFVVIGLGLFATAFLCILAIWDYTPEDTAWRALATLGVVATTMFTFTFINEMFGSRIDV